MNEHEIKMLIEERKSAQRRYSYSALAAAAGVWLAGHFVPCGTRKLLYIGAIGYALYMLWLTYKNWRCPACGKLLGQRLDIDECPHCKTRF